LAEKLDWKGLKASVRDPLSGEVMWVNMFFNCPRGPVFLEDSKKSSVLEREVELSELCRRPKGRNWATNIGGERTKQTVGIKNFNSVTKIYIYIYIF
jgi:hypothetical protein